MSERFAGDLANENEGRGRAFLLKVNKKERRCRGSNPGHPRDRREYSPLYYNDLFVKVIFYNNVYCIIFFNLMQTKFEKSLFLN